MLKPPSIDEVRAALALLEVEGFDDLEDAAGWKALQDKAKENHHRLALAAHPDRGGSTEAMAELNAAATLIKGINLRRVVRGNEGPYRPMDPFGMHQRRSRRGFHPGHGPLNDIELMRDLMDAMGLDKIFGGGGPMHARGPQAHRPRYRPMDPRNPSDATMRDVENWENINVPGPGPQDGVSEADVAASAARAAARRSREAGRKQEQEAKDWTRRYEQARKRWNIPDPEADAEKGDTDK
jgi:curved DNA-binding protein CbpA